MVIADTSVWISFFSQPDSNEKRILELLVDRGEIAMVGVVLAELLQGGRSADERNLLEDVLLALPYLEAGQHTWIRAGEISTRLLRKGITLSMSDLLIAALALEHDCAVYSLDNDFKKVSGLSLYSTARS
jgi:predicted nucleic acid-binding protein